MLAALTKERFSSLDWGYKRKLYGERILAYRDEGGVRLVSRNKWPLNDTYLEVAIALMAQPEKVVREDKG